jgi:hypothetical protein
MAIGKRTRSIDDVERARDMPEVEANSLATMAVAMFLGVLAEAEAAKRQQVGAIQPDDGSRPPPPADADAAISPAPAPAMPTPEDQPGDTTDSSPAVRIEPASAVEAAPLQQFELPQANAPSTVDTDVAQPDHHAEAVTDSAPAVHVLNVIDSSAWTGTSVTSSGHDLTAFDFGSTLTGTLQGVVTQLATALSDMSATLQQQLTSVALPDLSGLTASITGTVADAVDAALSVPASVADVLISNVFGSSPAAPVTEDHNGPMFDVGGIVPVSVDPMPLHVGFMGQPHLDGHDPHDGAFSALGIH